MRILFTLLFLLGFFAAPLYANEQSEKLTTINGEVRAKQGGEALGFATVIIDDNSDYATLTDERGRFRLKAPVGDHTISVSFVGYEPFEQSIKIDATNNRPLNIHLTTSQHKIDQIVVKGESQAAKINKISYNVQSIALSEIKNTTASMTNALARMSGVKIRESGGVGSESKIVLNGFSGNHVKIFIDGVQLDQTNSAFSLSNMPANFAERIDVYSGVVPIEFGADAIGGVINIVTNKRYRHELFNVDASYSYGSFNTHSSYVNVNQVFKSGFTYGVNLYQNYSDNNYWVTPDDVYKIVDGGTMSYVGSDRIQRYNDSYHNETAIVTVGVTNKSWADFLTMKLNYSQYFNNIQTGTTEIIVYGDKYRSGHSYTPTLEYSKRDLFVEGLDVSASANYVSGYTENYEGDDYQWDWYGNSKYNAAFTGVDSQMKNNNWAANLSVKYSFLDSHQLSLSHNFTNSNRVTRTRNSETNQYDRWDNPQDNIKNITGLSYRFKPNKRLDVTAFGKNYLQINEGTVMSDDTYYWDTSRESSVGYGAAASYFILKGLQTKLSYEKSYRLPTSTEIYGDGDLEQGTFDLNPENSHNLNLNLSYGVEVGKHNIVLEGSLIYRDTRDYIQRSTSSDVSRGTSSASYENFGRVETKGYTATIRYDYSRVFSIGGTYNNINSRNNESGLTSSGGSTITYGLRLPNTPYKYANADASANFFNVITKDDSITLNYDIFYQYEFPLAWESIGYKEDKMYIPTQLSHNVTLNYSLKQGTYNLSLEARNILDARLYDNYSLQKAGRAFYAKLRVNINKIKQ